MKRSFWRVVATGFYAAGGPAASFVAIGVTVLLWLLSPSTTIRLAIVLPFGLILLLFVWALVKAVMLALESSEQVLPSVIFVRPSGVGNAHPVLLLQPSQLFSHGTAVSVYYLDDKFERLIGVGAVINVQDDRKIQVAMLESAEGYQEIAQRLQQNDVDILRRILVKPTVPTEYLMSSRVGGQ